MALQASPTDDFLFLVLLQARNKREICLRSRPGGPGKGGPGFPDLETTRAEVALAATSLGTVGDGMGMVGW